MSVPKKLKTSNETLQDYDILESLSLPNSSSTFANNSSLNVSELRSSFFICYLPDEIILHIYNFLNPTDLLKISEIGNDRLRDLTLEIEHADFSSCRVVQPCNHISQYFTPSRIQHLKQLNFNYVVYNKAANLTYFICRCKKLTELSIVECGISYRNLRKILSSCLLLEKLSWDVSEATGKHMPYIHQAKVKTLNLYLQSLIDYSKDLNLVLKSFPYVQDVWLHCSSFLSIDSPLFGPWLCITTEFNSSLSQKYIMSVDCVEEYNFVAKNQGVLDILTREPTLQGWPISKRARAVSNNLNLKEKDTRFRKLLFPPHAVIKSDLEDASLLSSRPFNSFSTLSITLTSDIIIISDMLVENIKHAAGINLRHLSLNNCMPVNHPKATRPKPVSKEEALLTCEILDRIVETSKFITNLNLITVHFTSGSPFKAISKLKFLKSLCIPSCAFHFCDEDANKDNCAEEIVQFKELVQECILVEKFSFYCCPDYSKRFKDSDLIPVKDWKELKCLRLFSINFTRCIFLRKVADFCQKFKSLTINVLAYGNKCIYVPDVIYVLQKAKNLSFIQINDKSFYPVYERFWPSIGEASKLEGICIMTGSDTYIPTKDLLQAVKKLKNLHLFHLEASCCSTLESKIKKSMNSNHIINQRIIVGELKFVDAYSLIFYYHDQPYFCCRELHFRDVD